MHLISSSHSGSQQGMLLHVYLCGCRYCRFLSPSLYMQRFLNSWKAVSNQPLFLAAWSTSQGGYCEDKTKGESSHVPWWKLSKAEYAGCPWPMTIYLVSNGSRLEWFWTNYSYDLSMEFQVIPAPSQSQFGCLATPSPNQLPSIPQSCDCNLF